jgi:endonuclease YncB( thermonuclease family)
MRIVPLACLLALLLVPASADARYRAPCRPGDGGPKCFWWKAKVRLVADGDTIRVKIPGEGVHDIRFTGINAMEIRRYSHHRERRRGACHAVAATDFVDDLVGGTVYLAAQRISSRSGHRLRRTVWVRRGGKLVDVAAAELAAGLALWLPNKEEWAHNGEYLALAKAALAAKTALYNPIACGVGPFQDVPLRVTVRWDAASDDGHHLNSEWIDVHNDGLRAVPLAGWFVRESALRRDPGHRQPGHVFPKGAVAPAHGKVRVHVGRGKDGARNFYWGLREPIFENVKGPPTFMADGAYLFDPDGDLRAGTIYG